MFERLTAWVSYGKTCSCHSENRDVDHKEKGAHIPKNGKPVYCVQVWSGANGPQGSSAPDLKGVLPKPSPK